METIRVNANWWIPKSELEKVKALKVYAEGHDSNPNGAAWTKHTTGTRSMSEEHEMGVEDGRIIIKVTHPTSLTGLKINREA